MPRLQLKIFTIGSSRTSIRLEPIFWTALNAVAVERGLTATEIVHEVEYRRLREFPVIGRTSAVRIYLMRHYLSLATRKSRTARQAAASSSTQPASHFMGADASPEAEGNNLGDWSAFLQNGA